MKNRPTVTIAIAAYNEEANIKSLLLSLLAQKELNFSLEQIIVLSDGSTDRTVAEAISLKDKKIKVISSKKRLGLSARLTQLFRLNKSDIFIKTDADVILADDESIYYLVKEFKKDISLVSGQRQAVVEKNLLEKINKHGDRIWHLAKGDINNGHNIFNHHGTISAMRRDLVDIIRIPNGFIGNDDFIYLTALKNNKKFRFCPRILVFYRTPNNLKDCLKQHTRFMYAREMLSDYFGSWILSLYHVPLKNKIKALLSGFIMNPLLTTFYILVELIVRINLEVNSYKTVKYGWDITSSTKRRIPLDSYFRKTKHP